MNSELDFDFDFSSPSWLTGYLLTIEYMINIQWNNCIVKLATYSVIFVCILMTNILEKICFKMFVFLNYFFVVDIFIF